MFSSSNILIPKFICLKFFIAFFCNCSISENFDLNLYLFFLTISSFIFCVNIYSAFFELYSIFILFFPTYFEFHAFNFSSKILMTFLFFSDIIFDLSLYILFISFFWVPIFFLDNFFIYFSVCPPYDDLSLFI